MLFKRDELVKGYHQWMEQYHNGKAIESQNKASSYATMRAKYGYQARNAGDNRGLQTYHKHQERLFGYAENMAKSQSRLHGEKALMHSIKGDLHSEESGQAPDAERVSRLNGMLEDNNSQIQEEKDIRQNIKGELDDYLRGRQT
jgi:hypothetical protein